jgi:hypothetical protein
VTRRGRVFLVAALAALVAFVATGDPAAGAQRRVLVVTEATGFVHDSIPSALLSGGLRWVLRLA